MVFRFSTDFWKLIISYRNVTCISLLNTSSCLHTCARGCMYMPLCGCRIMHVCVLTCAHTHSLCSYSVTKIGREKAPFGWWASTVLQGMHRFWMLLNIQLNKQPENPKQAKTSQQTKTLNLFSRKLSMKSRYKNIYWISGPDAQAIRLCVSWYLWKCWIIILVESVYPEFSPLIQSIPPQLRVFNVFSYRTNSTAWSSNPSIV